MRDKTKKVTWKHLKPGTRIHGYSLEGCHTFAPGTVVSVNTAYVTYLAFDKAMSEYETVESGEIPPHILNREIGHNGIVYKYPHDYPDHWVNQEYMPKNLVGHRYYEGCETGAYERQLKARNIELQNRKAKK